MKYYPLLFFFLLLSGCSTMAGNLTDSQTKSEINIIEDVESDMSVISYDYDNMDRGNHEYYDQPVVVQQTIESDSLTRGTVILFEEESGVEKISRIVGLPKEKIQIKKGQVHINNQLLETFYGKAHRAGLDMKQYSEAMEEVDADYDEKTVKETFEKDLNEIKLAEDEYFLISDDWFRGDMKRVREDQILGIVLGYEK